MEFHQKNMRKGWIIGLICAVLILAGGGTVVFANYILANNGVIINDDGFIVKTRTTCRTVKDLIKKLEIALEPEDEITPGLDEKITEGTEIIISRAFKVDISVDGNRKGVYTTKGTVGETLEKSKIILGYKDIINYPINKEVKPGDHIKVTRVIEDVLVETEEIPYEVITKKNEKMEKGKEKVVQEGKEGKKEKDILVVYHDGEEVNREVMDERVSIEPVNQIIDKGSYVAPPPTPSPSQPVSRGSTEKREALAGGTTYTFQATAYTHTGNKTRTGVWPKVGMIAVDPSVIPLHTEVYIEFPKGWTHLNGYYKAMDTGGAISGKIIDVFMDTKEECRKFGRRSGLKVTIP